MDYIYLKPSSKNLILTAASTDKKIKKIENILSGYIDLDKTNNFAKTITAGLAISGGIAAFKNIKKIKKSIKLFLEKRPKIKKGSKKIVSLYYIWSLRVFIDLLLKTTVGKYINSNKINLISNLFITPALEYALIAENPKPNKVSKLFNSYDIIKTTFDALKIHPALVPFQLLVKLPEIGLRTFMTKIIKKNKVSEKKVKKKIKNPKTKTGISVLLAIVLSATLQGAMFYLQSKFKIELDFTKKDNSNPDNLPAVI